MQSEEADQITVPNVRIEKGIINIREYLADINMVGHSWNNADKVCVAAIATGNKLLAKVNELIKAKYTPTTAVLICIGKRITPKQLKELIATGKSDQLPNEEEGKLYQQMVNRALNNPDINVILIDRFDRFSRTGA